MTRGNVAFTFMSGLFFLMYSLTVNAANPDGKHANRLAFEHPWQQVPDSIVSAGQEQMQQRRYMKIIEMLTPYAEQQAGFPNTTNEAKAADLLATSYLSVQNPKGYVYLEKLLDYAQKSTPDSVLAKHYVNYSELLTFSKTMFSFELVNNALGILESGKTSNPVLLMKAYQVSGKNYISQGTPQQGTKQFKKALHHYHDQNINDVMLKQQLYSNVALSYNMTGQADSSLKYATLAHQTITTLPSPPEYALSSVYGNLSKALLLNGDIDSATIVRKKSLEINIKLTGDKSLQTGGSYYHLSNIYFYNEDYEQALKYIQKAILTNYPDAEDTIPYSTMPENLTHNSNVNAVLQSLMEKINYFEHLYATTGEKQWVKLAAEHYEAMDILVNQLQQSINMENLPMLIRLNRQGYDKALETFEQYQEAYPDKEMMEMMYYFATATKAKMLAYQIYNMKKSAAMAAGADSLKSARSEAERYLSRLKAQIQSAEDQAVSDSLQDEILLTRVRLSGLIDQLMQQPEGSSLNDITLNPVPLEAIRVNLKDNEAMLEYVAGNNQLYIFCSTSDSTIMKKVHTGEDFNRLYRNFMKTIKTGTQWKANALSDVLIKPVYEILKDKTHITVIPDNELHNIPFEALNIPGQEQPLITAHTVVYNYSAWLWTESKNSQITETTYDLVSYAPGFINEEHADIASRDALRGVELDDYRAMFADNNHKLLAPLPYSLEETDIITQLFSENNGSTKQYSGEHATEKQFRNTASARILHIATHGFSSKSNPEKSGLFFNPGNEPVNNNGYANDGILHINELFTIDLEADLVVLSACKSGAGKIMEGEGVYALPRGFIFAGVPNLMASLWKVHDEKTMQLITMFYQHLQKGETYTEALQAAKISMISKGELPLDWSGIILIGH